jgi:phosphatidylglycerophosphate synthase
MQRVAGVAAVSRMVLEAARAGLRDVAVVLAQPGDAPRVVRNDLARAKAPADVVFVPDLAAAAALAVARAGEPVVLLTGSAIVGKADIERLMEAGRDSAELQRSGAVIGRRLSAEALGRMAAGEPLPSDGAAGGRVIEAQSPQTISLRPARAATMAVLAQTGKPSDGLISRYLNRPISQRLSALLLGIPGLRPWQLTLLTLAFALVMFRALTLGSAWALGAGCLLFHSASLVDGLDGEVARATWRSSPKGAVFDTTVDMITNLLFILGLTVGLVRLRGAIYGEIGGFAFLGLLVGVVTMAFLLRKGRRGGSFDILKTVYANSAPERMAPLVSAVTVVTSRDFFALAFAVLGVLGLSWTIPWMMAGAVMLWLGLIVFAAPALLGGHTTEPRLRRLMGSWPTFTPPPEPEPRRGD